jgi:hypothetical protein
METRSDRRRLKAADILIHPEPQACVECQRPTHFAVFQPWAVRALCPLHLIPRLSHRSYTRLLRDLWDVVYQHTGNSLFEPQRAHGETLSGEDRWEKVGRSIHEQAARRADEAVSSMKVPAED